MIKNKKVLCILAGLIAVTGIVWAIGSPADQETAMSSPAVTVDITPEQIPGGGTTDQAETASPGKTTNLTATPKKTSTPTAAQSATPTQAVAATPAQTTTTMPTQSIVSTPTQTAEPTPTPTATASPTETPGFSYSVYNDDGVAPAGYTIVYVKITPNGSYHVTYDGTAITKCKTGAGYITYYKTVEKLEDGN